MVGLAFSFAIASPVVGLINKTFLPAILGNEISAGTVSAFFITIFALILYFSVLKGVITWIFVLPQSLPDQVLRIISAGIGDLGEGRALQAAEASEGAGRLGAGSLDNISKAGSEHATGAVKKRAMDAEKAKKEAGEKFDAAVKVQNTGKDAPR